MSRYHHGNLKAQLIASGLSVLQKDGLKAFSIRKVALKAGVSHNAPYRHFKNKTELLAAIAVEGYKIFMEMIETRLMTIPDEPLARFQELSLCYLDFARSHSDYYRVMFGQSIRKKEYPGELMNIAMRCFEINKELLKPLLPRDESDSDEILTQSTLTLWATVHGLVMLFLDGKLPPPYTDISWEELPRLLQFNPGVFRTPVPQSPLEGEP